MQKCRDAIGPVPDHITTLSFFYYFIRFFYHFFVCVAPYYLFAFFFVVAVVCMYVFGDPFVCGGLWQLFRSSTVI